MTSSPEQVSARRRASYTAEPYSRALQEVRKLSRDAPLIASAAKNEQQLLEAEVLLAFRHVDLGPEMNIATFMRPSLAALSYAVPNAASLELWIESVQLPIACTALLPVYFDGSGGGRKRGLRGVPGLRAYAEERRVVLHRVGEAAKITLRGFTRSAWKKSLASVRADLGRRGAEASWELSPAEWTAPEMDLRNQRYGRLSSCSWLPSGLLRRIGMFRRDPSPTRVDVLWHGSGRKDQHPPHFYLSWDNGPSVDAIRNALTDDACGLGLRIVGSNENQCTLSRISDGWPEELELRQHRSDSAAVGVGDPADAPNPQPLIVGQAVQTAVTRFHRR